MSHISNNSIGLENKSNEAAVQALPEVNVGSKRDCPMAMQDAQRQCNVHPACFWKNSQDRQGPTGRSQERLRESSYAHIFGPFLSNNKKGKFSVRFGFWIFFATKRRRLWGLMGVVLRWRMAASPSWDSSSTFSLPHLWATKWEDILIFPWALQSPTTNYHKSNFKAPHASKYFKISRMKNFIFWLCVLVVVVVLLMILVLELVVAATAKSHSPTQCQAGCFLQRDN